MLKKNTTMLTNVAHVWCIYCTDLFQIITESCCLCSHLSLVLFQYNEFHEEQQNENSLLFTLKASVSNSAASCILTNSVRSLICPCHSLQFPPVIPSLMLFLFLLLSFFFFFPSLLSHYEIFFEVRLCVYWTGCRHLGKVWQPDVEFLDIFFKKIHFLSRKTDKFYLTTKMYAFVCKCMW